MKKILLALVMLISCTVNVYAYEQADYTAKLDNIKSLLDDCAAQNIPTPYEQAAYTTMSVFANYMETDADTQTGNETRLSYNDTYLNSLYQNTKTALEGYIANPSSAKENIKQYGGQDFNISGNKLVDDSGNPYFSVGYGHFLGQTAIGSIADFGMNNAAVEMGPSNITNSTDVCNWKLTSGSGTLERTDDGMLKMVRGSDEVSFSQIVPVEKNSTYTVTARIKTNDAVMGDTVWVGNTSKNVNTELADKTWTVSTDASGFYDLCFTVKLGGASGIYFDDITMVKSGGTANVVKNGDFAKGKGYRFNNIYQDIYDRLNWANQNGIAMNVLLSPHYVPEFFMTTYPDYVLTTVDEDGKTVFDKSKNNFGVVINAPEILEFYEEYFAFAAHMIKDYPALSSIILANEPLLQTNASPDFYNAEFQKWLGDKYDNDTDALQTALGTEYSQFSEVAMPETITGTALDYDYICFNEDQLADFFKAVSTAVRSETNKPLSIKTQDYLRLESTNLTLDFMKKGNNIEKLNSSIDMAGCDQYTAYVVPKTRVNTMAWYDMLSSLTGKPIYNSEEHNFNEDNWDYDAGKAQNMEYSIWQGAIHNKVMSSLWLYGRDNDDKPTFTIMEQADSTYKAAETALRLNENANVLSAFLDKEAEIGIYLSNATRLYDTASFTKALYDAYKTAIATGRKVGFVTEDNIAKVNDYKAVIVPAVSYTKASALKGLKNYSGKLILTGNCFTGDEHKNSLDAELVSAVTAKATQTADLAGELDAYFDSDIKLVDENGNAVTNIDWQFAAKNGKMYVNLCYLGEDTKTAETKDIYVSYDGENVAVTDEFTSASVMSVSASKNEPYLLSFDLAAPEFELLSITDSSLKVRNNSSKAARVQIKAILYAEDGTTVKGCASNKRTYGQGEEKVINFGFSGKLETDRIAVMAIDENGTAVELTIIV